MSDFNPSTEEPKLPAIIGIEGITDPATKRVLQAVKEILEIRTGQRPRSSDMDRAVTFRDLYKYNIASFTVNGKSLSNPTPDTAIEPVNTGITVEDTVIPGAPLGLLASGTKLSVLLEWDAGATSIAYTEIYRAADDNIGNAVLIGTTTATIYADILNEAGLTRYYWIRFVNPAGISGDFNAITGTVATTGQIGSADIVSLDGAKIIDATILNAKISNVSADKIVTGTLQATEVINVGTAVNRIFIDGQGIIRSAGALGFMNGSGFHFQVNGGISTAFIGNSSNFFAWDGSRILINSENLTLTDTQLHFNGSGTFNGNGTFSGALQAASGSFSGELQAASGSFTGELIASTGSFGGELLAGVLDFSKFSGIKYTYIVPGVYTITVPLDKTTMRVSICGGAGGGGASGGNNNNNNGAGGGGGGSNNVVATFSNLTPGATYTLTIGDGGDGANWFWLPGQSGQQSSISGLITANGGGGGQPGGSFGHQNGSGGIGSNGANNGGVGSGYIPQRQTGGQLGSPVIVIPATQPMRGLGGASTNGGAKGGDGGEGAMDVNPPRNVGSYDAIVGRKGQAGKALIEFFNPNSVVIQTEYNILISALQRQGIATV